jgi:hypothetical protein
MDKKEKSYWLKVALNSGFDDKHSAKIHLEHILKIIDKLPKEVILYRIVYLDSPSDLNKLKPGTHYVLNKKSLLKNHYLTDIVYSHSTRGEPYLITVKIDKDKVDIPLTIDNNLRYPNEEEISLKNKGSGAKIIDLKKIK